MICCQKIETLSIWRLKRFAKRLLNFIHTCTAQPLVNYNGRLMCWDLALDISPDINDVTSDPAHPHSFVHQLKRLMVVLPPPPSSVTCTLFDVTPFRSVEHLIVRVVCLLFTCVLCACVVVCYVCCCIIIYIIIIIYVYEVGKFSFSCI